MRLLTLRTVLVATDLDPSSDPALDSAHRLAKSAGAALHVVHVVAWAHEGNADTPRADSEDAVRRALRRASVPEDAASIHLIPGSAADVIRSLADRMAADVVVLGPHRTRGRGTTDQELGGTAQAVVQRTFAPCLVVARPLRLPLERVLVPVDLSETARGALLVALSWASALRTGTPDDPQTSLNALYVDTNARDGGDADAAAALERELRTVGPEAGDWAGVRIEATAARDTDAPTTIANHAIDRRADLVVLGTRGLGMDDAVRLGSVSATLTARLKLPMLLVPPGVWRAHAAVP